MILSAPAPDESVMSTEDLATMFADSVTISEEFTVISDDLCEVFSVDCRTISDELRCGALVVMSTFLEYRLIDVDVMTGGIVDEV